MKCPYCGRDIKPKASRWDGQARLLAAALSKKYGDAVFKGRDAENLALECRIANNQAEAYLIWGRLRQMEIIAGVGGEMHYHEWKVKEEGHEGVSGSGD